MKIRLLIIALAMCVIATPAMGGLFEITVTSPKTVYDGVSTFTANANSTIPGAQGSLVIGEEPPAIDDIASFLWGMDLGSFSLEMTLSNINNTLETANGDGSFTFFDVDGDKIIANLTGQWTRDDSFNYFEGLVSSVYYIPNNVGENTFDGGTGFVDMGFGSPQPWNGGITEITTQTNWFGNGQFDVKGGSIDITVVPVPAAVILGILGLGVVGIKLRKYA